MTKYTVSTKKKKRKNPMLKTDFEMHTGFCTLSESIGPEGLFKDTVASL